MPDLDLDDLAVECEGAGLDKRLMLAQAQQSRAVAEAMARIAAAVDACSAELHRLNNPQAAIEDDPWEAAEQAQKDREARAQETKRNQSSARRDRARGGGVAATQKRRERGLSD